MFQIKEQENKNPEKSTDETEINNLPDGQYSCLENPMDGGAW